jgi:hypothetical protein
MVLVTAYLVVPACYGYAPNLSCKYGISLKNACNLAFSALAAKGSQVY